MSLSLLLAGCAGPQQLQNYSSRQGSLAEVVFYKVQYKRTVGSPRDLAGQSLAKFKPKQPFMVGNATQACLHFCGLVHLIHAVCVSERTKNNAVTVAVTFFNGGFFSQTTTPSSTLFEGISFH